MRAGSTCALECGGFVEDVIESMAAAGAYVAFHCGTTQNGSNLNGLLETFELTGSGGPTYENQAFNTI